MDAPAWQNDRNTAVGGVVFLLNKDAANALASMDSLGDRILVVHFHGNPSTSLIVQYSPTPRQSRCVRALHQSCESHQHHTETQHSPCSERFECSS